MQLNKPVTEVLLKHKQHQQLEEFAITLEKIAQKLRQDGHFTFVQGDQQVQVSPGNNVKVTYEYTKKATKHSFEIQFDWIEGSPKYGKIGIE